MSCLLLLSIIPKLNDNFGIWTATYLCCYYDRVILNIQLALYSSVLQNERRIGKRTKIIYIGFQHIWSNLRLISCWIAYHFQVIKSCRYVSTERGEKTIWHTCGDLVVGIQHSSLLFHRWILYRDFAFSESTLSTSVLLKPTYVDGQTFNRLYL